MELYNFVTGLLCYSPEVQHVAGFAGIGGTAEEALDAINGMIDNMTKIAVLFSLHTGVLCRNG